MKTTYLFTCLLCSILPLVLISCTDHHEPGLDKMRVRTLTREIPAEPGVKYISLLQYDSQGRLGTVFSYQTPDSAISQTQTSSYQYDQQGRLSQMDRTLSQGGSERYVYSYDQTGKSSKIRYTGADNEFYDFTFNYDSDGSLLSTRRYFNYFSALSFEQVHAYTFSLGNVSSLVSTTTVVKAVPGTSIVATLLVYDGHPNPFYGVVLIPAPTKIGAPSTGNFGQYTYYGGIDNFLHMSKNNLVLSLVKGFSQTSYEYTYNASGLPVSRRTLVKAMLDQPAVLLETLLYEYENY